VEPIPLDDFCRRPSGPKEAVFTALLELARRRKEGEDKEGALTLAEQAICGGDGGGRQNETPLRTLHPADRLVGG
jgi:hypothetical protein